jgi:hypothetical protein
LSELDSTTEIGFPDVAARDEAQRKYNRSALNCIGDLSELIRGAIKIDVKTSNGKFGCELDVGIEAGEISGEHDLG